jgi:hypothetical protein
MRDIARVIFVMVRAAECGFHYNEHWRAGVAAAIKRMEPTSVAAAIKRIGGQQ